MHRAPSRALRAALPVFRWILTAALLVPLSETAAQNSGYFAILPAFHDRLNRSGLESPLQLNHQKFVVFVYRNAVAVYSEADFFNPTQDTIRQELALPSTGHDENLSAPESRVSNGILSVRMWIEGEKMMPRAVSDANEDWITVTVRFAPAQARKVKALFWAQTSLANVESTPGLDTVPIDPGPRGFMLDLLHAGVWGGPIGTIDVTVLFKGGLRVGQDSVTAEPETYESTDTSLTWSMTSLEPLAGDNIVLFYRPAGPWPAGPNTMAHLSEYIVRKVYDTLLYVAGRRESE